MINEVCRKIGCDLNITKFKNETENEYTQRVIFSASSMWVRMLIYGKSVEDFGNVYPDIMYVQTRLAKVINGYLECMEVNLDWITVNDAGGKIEMKLASAIITEMLETYNIGEVNERQLCHVPYNHFSYGNWVQIRGNDSYASDIYSIGVSQWKKKEVDAEYEIESKIIDQKGENYVGHLRNNSTWKTVSDILNFNIFQVGLERGYSKCWKPYINSKVKDGFYLIKEQSEFNGGYSLLEKKNGILQIATIEPWYIETREIYRIMYALNYENGTPAKFRLRVHEDYIILALTSALPDYENRIILSLSWPYRDFSDKYVRIISNKNLDTIEKLILDLGAELVYN